MLLFIISDDSGWKSQVFENQMLIELSALLVCIELYKKFQKELQTFVSEKERKRRDVT